MTELKSVKGSSQNTTHPHGSKTKVYRWLIGALIFGGIAIILLILINVVSILRYGDTLHYSPANFEAEFERNREKWYNAHITHYQMVVDFSGYGSYSYDQLPWTLEIRNDKIVSAINSQGNSVQDIDSAHWFIVSALFADIQKRYQYSAPSIQVSYNPTYGYPEHIAINPWSEPCCQDYEIEIQDFKVLP